MEDRNAVLFTGGSGPGRDVVTRIIGENHYVMAADSGLDLALNYNIHPDMVVGDMDSLKTIGYLDKMPEEKKRIYPRDKDETDTEIGLELLYENGYNRITVIGGGGGRIDHFLGIFSLFFKDRYPVEWYTHDCHLACIDRPVRIHGPVGGSVSFFPSSRGICRTKSTGFRWNLDNLVWSIGDSGISNVILETPCTVTPLEGKLLLVAALGEEIIVE